MDADSDGRVTREELKQFVSFKMQRLRAAFGTVDRDSDGFITAHEVQAVLEAAHLKATVEDTETLLRVMQAGAQDSKVSFPQFLATFALLEPLDLLAMFDKDAHLFELGSAGDLAGVLKGRQLTRRQTQALEKKAATNDNLALRLFAAGIAATLAQTACQPIETVKVRLQNEANLAAAKKRYGSFTNGGLVIAREEGMLALWKGMAPSAVREMSYSSIRFGLYAPIKKILIGEGSPAEVPLWKKIVAGGLAGGLGSAIANPTDLVKIRMQADSNVVPKRMLVHCADIYRGGGVAGFWMGTSTTVARAVVLGATKLATYDEAKLLGKKYLGLQGLPLQTVAGALAGFAYVCTSAPVDFTRTRLMTARQMAQQTGVAVEYSGPMDVFFKTIRTEGPRALYKGFFPQWARATPYSVIQFLAWEQMAKAFKVSTVD
eukprot:Tamp_07576.p1 GENE.Tamp_07576~~Tamp_07576.p1  ORF type:complete len:489 (+),score=98.94 Tamp_07576:173-1468(+)